MFMYFYFKYKNHDLLFLNQKKTEKPIKQEDEKEEEEEEEEKNEEKSITTDNSATQLMKPKHRVSLGQLLNRNKCGVMASNLVYDKIDEEENKEESHSLTSNNFLAKSALDELAQKEKEREKSDNKSELANEIDKIVEVTD